MKNKSLPSGYNKHTARLYEQYRPAFLAFAQKYYSAVNKEAAEEIYHDSFATLCEDIHKEKFKEGVCTIKTYLFSIGKNKFRNYIRNHKIENKIEYTDSMPECFLPSEKDDWILMQEIIYEVVINMKEPCNTLLLLFHWEDKSMEEIAPILNYKNSQVVRNKKHKCMQILKEKLNSKLNEEELL